jgi:aminoglycoside phosphotransferase (APT) family kinase protein
MTTGSPAAEVDITEALVRKLLRAQHADLADLPLEFAGEGWDNVMVRLGEDLVLRLPRRSVADQLLRNEQRWLPELAAASSAACSGAAADRPFRDEGYPYAWSVLRWIEGETADLAPPDASEAPVLAQAF